MKIITTHLSADFDAFAAAVCAVRLYPDHRVLFPGSQELAVRRFLEETGLDYPELKLRQARRETFEHAVVVDTRNPARLGEVWGLLERDGCPITLIDHHVTEDDRLGAGMVESRPLGATCSIIAQLYRERGLEPSSEEASLLLMGIYEDTGGLSYRDTRPADLQIAGWLLECGGSLAWVRRWVMKGLQPEQLALLNRLVEATDEVSINGVRVAVSLVEVDRYHEEAAYVVHRWVETFDLPVGVAMLVRPPHTNLILRSHLEGLHVGRVAQDLGGGGHATAASARVSDLMPVEVRERLLAALEREMPPPATACQIATSTIISVATTDTVAAAKDLINRRRINAAPVHEADGERLVGMVTRQILDRALGHEMADRPVSAVMDPELPRVAPETPLVELRDLFLERSFRFVVVERTGRALGLVTRMDLFRHLFERQHAAGAAIDHRMAGRRPVSQSVTRLLRSAPAPWVRDLLKTAKAVADTVGIPVYLVGGMVRDLLLGRPNEDLDLVVEGSGIDFAHALAAFAGGRCHPHQPFLNAAVTLPGGHRVDVASARTEFYRTPAALPEVATSLIRQDLYRRDFTVNSLAVALHGERFGQLVDFFGGRRDLDRREIRVLHSLSFIDDPTRAIRAVRYARRLDFEIAADTRNLIATAVREGVFDHLSGQRLRRELALLLEEGHPTPSLELVAELGLLPAICPGLVWNDEVRSRLLELEAQLAWFQLQQLGDRPEPWRLFLAGVALASGADIPARLGERLQLSGEAGRRFAALPEEVEMVRAAVALAPASARVRAVEERPVEVVLLAMAMLDLDGRQRLARAFEAAVRVRPGVGGAALLAQGIPPGAHIGQALKLTRDALVDGIIEPAGATDHAVATARRLAGGTA